MRVYYGWVIVGVGIVVSCIGVGTMMSLTVFLQPVSAEMGWSRAGISAASMLAFLCLGVSSFAWGAASDRYGTRAVVLAGGVLLGLGLGAASRAVELWQFQALFGILVGSRRRQLLYAAHRDDHELVHPAPQPRGRPGLGGAGPRRGDRGTARDLDHRRAWLAHGDARARRHRLGRCHPGRAAVTPAACPAGRRPIGGRRRCRAQRGAGAANAAVRRDRTHLLRLLRGAFRADLPHGQQRCWSAGLRRSWPPRCSARRGSAGSPAASRFALIADRVGAKPVLVVGLGVQALAILLYTVARDLASLYALSALFGFAYGGVMPLYAILVRQYFGARIMGATFGAAVLASTLGMAIGPLAGGWIFDTFASLLLALRRLVRGRAWARSRSRLRSGRRG